MTLPGETSLPLPVPDGSERKGTPPYPPKGGTAEDTGGVEADRGILLGHVLAGDAPVRIRCEDPELSAHVGTPWLSRWLRGEGIETVLPGSPVPGSQMRVGMAELGRHAVLIGRSGMGKSMLALTLLREQVRRGCSALVMDVKAQTIAQALHLALEAGVPREDITVLWPGSPRDGVPGWNPLDGDENSAQRVSAAFTGLIREGSTAWGDRMEPVLKYAATLVAAQGLSLVELDEFLGREEYRTALLAKARRLGHDALYPKAYQFYARDFQNMGKSERSGAAQPVLTRISAFLDIPFLRSLVAAPADTLDLPGLWKRRRVVLVHLDRGQLGDDGVRLLSGMLARSLYDAAMAKADPGPRPVVLMVDEMGIQAKFLGGAVADILAIARSQKLRMLIAAQFLDQLETGLRDGLLTNTEVRAFFNLNHADARRVAAELAAGNRRVVRSVTLEATRAADKYAPAPTACVTVPITNQHGRAMQLSPAAWAAWRGMGGTLPHLERLLGASGVSLPGARDGMTLWTLREYVRKAPAGSWEIGGPEPLSVTVRFPRPKVSVERDLSGSQQAALEDALGTLGKQQAVVRVGTASARVRVADMELPEVANLPDPARFLNGNSRGMIVGTERNRRAAMDRLAGETDGRTDSDAAIPRSAVGSDMG